VTDGGTSPDDDRFDLLDVRSFPTDKLILSKDTVLKNAVDRVISDVGRTTRNYAAFDSITPPDEEPVDRPADGYAAFGDAP
jgi:hypothetical protein